MNATCRVLMVCMGNICRSPSAEAVLRQGLQAAGLGDRVEVDSAGTSAGHAGHPPDARAVAHAARRVRIEDFERFDYLLAMDHDNERSLLKFAPAHCIHKVKRLMEFAPEETLSSVPDPYYGGAAGFEKVLDLIELACGGLIEHLHSQQGRASDQATTVLPPRL
jgi:protein-tyrosine phosphatase